VFEVTAELLADGVITASEAAAIRKAADKAAAG
jgi:hypothetical protein